MVIGCIRLTDVSVIDTIRSYENRQKFGVGFLYAAYSPGERLWIDSNGKMETSHPVEGPFESEFPANSKGRGRRVP